MEVQLFNFKRDHERERPTPKKGVVTGAAELSQVESMIQRYLQLAEAALKGDQKVHRDEEAFA